MTHKDDASYDYSPSEIEPPLRDQWRVGADSAEGPCPVCAGGAWGPPLPDIEIGKGGGALNAPGGRNAYAANGYTNWNCDCDFEHKEGKRGCGAYGVIRQD